MIDTVLNSSVVSKAMFGLTAVVAVGILTATTGAGAAKISESSNIPSTKDQCKNGGFSSFGFKNQGQCVSSVASSGNGSGYASSLE